MSGPVSFRKPWAGKSLEIPELSKTWTLQTLLTWMTAGPV